jgi:hypothetical protein
VFVVVQSIMTRSRGKDKVDPDQSIKFPEYFDCRLYLILLRRSQRFGVMGHTRRGGRTRSSPHTLYYATDEGDGCM